MYSHSTQLERDFDFEEPAYTRILHSTPLRRQESVQPIVFPPPTVSTELLEGRESPLTFNDLSLTASDGSNTSVPEDAEGHV